MVHSGIFNWAVGYEGLELWGDTWSGDRDSHVTNVQKAIAVIGMEAVTGGSVWSGKTWGPRISSGETQA